MIVFSILCFGENRIFAQTESGKILKVELIIPDEELGKVSNEFEVPDNFDFKNSLIGGGFATVDCINCELPSSYQFWIFKAENFTGHRVKFGINASFENKPVCNTNKEFSINPNKKETVNLKCGVKLIIYSASRSKTKET